MKHIIEKNGGFTLIEVLISMTILSIILLGMMAFFTNGLSFVKENEQKTVATQVARNVMNYVEKQDFSLMEAYITAHAGSSTPSSNYDSPYTITLNNTSCIGNEKYDLSIKPFPSATERIELKGVSLFPNEDQCKSIFSPTLNNITFNENTLNVFVMKYNETELDSLLELIDQNDASVHLPDSVQKAIKSGLQASDQGAIDDHLLRVFVQVEWDGKREAILLQGVIAHESIR